MVYLLLYLKSGTQFLVSTQETVRPSIVRIPAQAVLDLVSSVEVPGSWLKMSLTKPVSGM